MSTWELLRTEDFTDDYWERHATGGASITYGWTYESRRSTGLRVSKNSRDELAYAEKVTAMASEKYHICIDVLPVSVDGEVSVVFSRRDFRYDPDPEIFFGVAIGEAGDFRIRYVDVSGNQHTVSTESRLELGTWNTLELVVDWVHELIRPGLNGRTLAEISTASIRKGAILMCRIGDWTGSCARADVCFGCIRFATYENTARTALQRAQAVAEKWKERTQVPGSRLWRSGGTPPGDELHPEVEISQRYDIQALQYLYLVNGDGSHRQALTDYVQAGLTDGVGLHTRINQGTIARYGVATCTDGNPPIHETLHPAPNEALFWQRPSEYVRLWERAYREKSTVVNRWGYHHWMPYCWFWANVRDLENYEYRTEYNEMGDSGSRSLAELWRLYVYTSESKWREIFDDIVDTSFRERSQYTNLMSGCCHRTMREGAIQIDHDWSFELFSLDVGVLDLYFFLLCLDDLHGVPGYFRIAKLQADSWAKFCWRGDEVGGGWFGRNGGCDVGSADDVPWHFWEWMAGVFYARMAALTGDLRYRRYATDILIFLRNHKWRMEDKSLLLSAQLAAYLYLETRDSEYWSAYEEFMHFFEHVHVAEDWIYATCYSDSTVIGFGPDQTNIGNGSTHFWTIGMYIFNQLMRDSLKPMLCGCPFTLLYPVATKSPILPPADRFHAVRILGPDRNVIEIERTETSSQDVFVSVGGLVVEGYTVFSVSDESGNPLDFGIAEVGGYYFLKIGSTTARVITITGARDETPPRPICDLEATPAGETRIGLSWTASADLDTHHYEVFRHTEHGFEPGPENLIAVPRTNSWLDAPLVPGGRYHYRVRAVDLAGNKGGLSPEAVATVKPVRTAVFVDDMDDFSKVYAHSAKLDFDSSDPERFDGDTCRLKRTADSSEHVVYRLGDMQRARLYTYWHPEDVAVGYFRFYVSADGSGFDEVVPLTIEEGCGEWRRVVYTIPELPHRTCYLKIEFGRGSTGRACTPQIGRVEIGYIARKKADFFVLRDEMDDFTIAHSHTPGLAFDHTNVCDFEGDRSRLRRTGPGRESVTYFASDIEEFEVTGYSRDASLGPEALRFYASTDGIDFTEVAARVEDLGGTWRKLRYTAEGLTCTNYLRVEFRETGPEEARSSQIGTVEIGYRGNMLMDNMDDLRWVTSHTGELSFDSLNSDDFDGKRSRLRSIGKARQDVVYSVTGLTGFVVWTYWPNADADDSMGRLRFYVSGDGRQFSETVPMVSRHDGVHVKIIYSKAGLGNANHLKIEFPEVDSGQADRERRASSPRIGRIWIVV